MTTPQLTDTQLQFRSAMAQLSASVNVVTTRGDHGEVGPTMTAVCSVSDNPPTLLACINRKSALRDIFLGNGRLCVNILNDQHEGIALEFAGATGVPMQERFASDAWIPAQGTDDQPRLHSAVASLEGRIVSTLEQGSHTVMFMEADAIHLQEEAGGLVYFQRTFHPMGSSLSAVS